MTTFKISREAAIAFADTAAAAVLGTTAARTAGFAATFGLSPGVLGQFVIQNGLPPSSANALYSFAVASQAKGKPVPWERASETMKAASYAFCGTLWVLMPAAYLHESDEDEARRAKASQAQPRIPGGKTFEKSDNQVGRNGFLKKVGE